MRVPTSCSFAAVAAALSLQPMLSVSAWAQEQAPTTPEGPDPALSEDDLSTIIVEGSRLIGRVDAPQPPILELSEADIAAYGVGSIAELLEQLGPEISSGRGRGGGGQPVILVNGIRVGSFRELRSYPPEAIERFEVFTEEVAQRFGYSADQRVVNIILKDNYQSYEIEGEYSQPWDGGFSSQEVEATYLRIDGNARLNLNLEWENTSLLTEAERGIIQTERNIPTVPTDPDPAAFRSLVGDSSGFEATANWNNAISESGTTLSLNATYERDNSLRLQGLDTVLLTDPAGNSAQRSFNAIDPLAVDRSSDSYSTAATLNAGIGDWQVTGTIDATLTEARTQTQARVDTASLVTAAANGDLAIDADLGMFPDAGFDRADSQTYTINALATARGNPLYIPGGDVSMTLVAGYRGNGIESTDTRDPSFDTDLDRSRFQAGVNLGIPVTSRDEDFGAAFGDITLNFNTNVYEQSDFGTLFDWSAGVTWGIFGDITLSATYINRDGSPSLTELGAPNIATPNVPVFDFTNNETVLATVITGGNPDLLVQEQSDWVFGINWRLPFVDRGSLQLQYFDNSSRNISSGFPVLTPAIEAAFADRVERDATGTLTLLDERFVNFAQQDVQRLRVGLNMGGQFGGGDEDARGGGQRGGGERGGPPQGARPGGGPGGGERGGRPNAEQFAAMRERFCSAETETLVTQFNAVLEAQQNGTEPPTDEEGNPINIPPQMLQRLVGDDGRISAERIEQAKQFICNAEGGRPGGPGAGQGAGQGGQGGGQRGRGGGGRRGGGFPFGGNDDGPPVARWFANLNYTYEIDNTVLIADGIPRLDLLDGDALSGGGQARHSAQWRSGIFYDGMGVLLFANYTGSSEIRGSGLPGSTDLFFDDFATVDIRTFFDIGQRDSWVEAVPFLQNVRVGFDVTNIFDSRQRVVDSNGDTPLRYQPFLLDPRGRTFEIEFRKLF